MRVCKHAVKRYKQRVGNRTSSRDKVISLINKEIENRTMNRWKTKSNHVYIETTKFVAVCYHDMVITILPLGFQDHGDEEIVL
jgi:hypothetical protein